MYSGSSSADYPDSVINKITMWFYIIHSWITTFERMLHSYSNWKYLCVTYCTPYQRTSHCFFYPFLTAKNTGCTKEMERTLDFVKYWQSGQQVILMDCSDRHGKYLLFSLAVSESQTGRALMLLRLREVTVYVSVMVVRRILWGHHVSGSSLIWIGLRSGDEAVTWSLGVLFLEEPWHRVGHRPGSIVATQRYLSPTVKVIGLDSEWRTPRVQNFINRHKVCSHSPLHESCRGLSSDGITEQWPQAILQLSQCLNIMDSLITKFVVMWLSLIWGCVVASKIVRIALWPPMEIVFIYCIINW